MVGNNRLDAKLHLPHFLSDSLDTQNQLVLEDTKLGRIFQSSFQCIKKICITHFNFDMRTFTRKLHRENA